MENEIKICQSEIALKKTEFISNEHLNCERISNFQLNSNKRRFHITSDINISVKTKLRPLMKRDSFKNLNTKTSNFQQNYLFSSIQIPFQSLITIIHCLNPSKLNIKSRSFYPTKSTKFSSILCYAFIFFTIFLSDVQCRKKVDVHIAGFFPVGPGPKQALGRGVMPALNLAINDVNDHPTVLRNYKLHVKWNDTLCDTAIGTKAFFDMMYNPPQKVMLFGAACTHVTDPIVKTAKHWHITQLSYADTHPMFSAVKYPNFFRMAPSDKEFNMPRIRLLQSFNWTRVGTLFQNKPRHALAHNHLLSLLELQNFTIAETQSFADHLGDQLTKLLNKDARIILGYFDESWARKIFCEAYKKGLYGKNFQWVITGMYRNRWWTLVGDEDERTNYNKNTDKPSNQSKQRKNLKSSDQRCSVEEVETALSGCIMIDLLPLATNDSKTVSGKTISEYKKKYMKASENQYSRFHGYTYDGVWALALAIQSVGHTLHKKNRALGTNTTIQDFSYRDENWGSLFNTALSEVQFEGVTGHVEFDADNARKGHILFKQFREKEEVEIGEYDGFRDVLRMYPKTQIFWPGGDPPIDRTIVLVEKNSVDVNIFAVLVTLSCLGIVMATVFLAINIKFRSQRYIKMSSPYLNNLIIIGCIFTYTSVILLGLDSGLANEENFPMICTSRAWVLMSGFTLAFGSMFSKTWRVHSIFADVQLNKKVIKDYMLYLVVFILLLIDIAIMTTWQIVDPFTRETKRMQPYMRGDIKVIPLNEYCMSHHISIFVGCIYAYKGLLMMFGCFLAWETRYVSIPALNDSKYIGMSVYNVVIMCTIGAPLSYILSDEQDAMYLIISAFILFCTTLTLCLVFVPKIIELKRNPQGTIDKRMIRPTLKPPKRNDSDSDASDIREVIRKAETDKSIFSKKLKEKEEELAVLCEDIGEESDEIITSITVSKPPLPPARTNNLAPKETLRIEVPSYAETTEATEITSVYSEFSHQDDERRCVQSNILSSLNSAPKLTTSVHTLHLSPSSYHSTHSHSPAIHSADFLRSSHIISPDQSRGNERNVAFGVPRRSIDPVSEIHRSQFLSPQQSYYPASLKSSPIQNQSPISSADHRVTSIDVSKPTTLHLSSTYEPSNTVFRTNAQIEHDATFLEKSSVTPVYPDQNYCGMRFRDAQQLNQYYNRRQSAAAVQHPTVYRRVRPIQMTHVDQNVAVPMSSSYQSRHLNYPQLVLDSSNLSTSHFRRGSEDTILNNRYECNVYPSNMVGSFSVYSNPTATAGQIENTCAFNHMNAADRGNVHRTEIPRRPSFKRDEYLDFNEEATADIQSNQYFKHLEPAGLTSANQPRVYGSELSHSTIRRGSEPPRPIDDSLLVKNQRSIDNLTSEVLLGKTRRESPSSIISKRSPGPPARSRRDEEREHARRISRALIRRDSFGQVVSHRSPSQDSIERRILQDSKFDDRRTRFLSDSEQRKNEILESSLSQQDKVTRDNRVDVVDSDESILMSSRVGSCSSAFSVTSHTNELPKMNYFDGRQSADDIISANTYNNGSNVAQYINGDIIRSNVDPRLEGSNIDHRYAGESMLLHRTSSEPRDSNFGAIEKRHDQNLHFINHHQLDQSQFLQQYEPTTQTLGRMRPTPTFDEYESAKNIHSKTLDRFSRPTHVRAHSRATISSVAAALAKSKSKNASDNALDHDVSILPIFQKLLCERQRSFRSGHRSKNDKMSSCPNITIKCDIVEYL